jgi:hypothetical protein
MFVKENEACFRIFGKSLFVEMKSSKLNNYLTETWQTCYSNMAIILLTNLFCVCVQKMKWGEALGFGFDAWHKGGQQVMHPNFRKSIIGVNRVVGLSPWSPPCFLLTHQCMNNRGFCGKLTWDWHASDIAIVMAINYCTKKEGSTCRIIKVQLCGYLCLSFPSVLNS